MARSGEGRVRGVLPCYRTGSLFTGLHYTTLDGGALAETDAVRNTLTAAAKNLRNERGVRFVQIRGGRGDDHAPFQFTTVHTVVPTYDGPGAAWAAIKPKTRWGIRQAERQELEVALDAGLHGLQSFYGLYAAHMHELGTPVFGIRTLHAMHRHLGSDRMRLHLLKYRGRLVGGMLCIVHGNRWTDLYAIVRRAQAPEFANYLLYWRVIRDAAENGVRELDLGRSMPGSNVHLFKRKWGGFDVDVPYLFYPAANRRNIKMGLLGENRAKGLPQKIWSRLPLSLCNALGPIIRRDLPFL